MAVTMQKLARLDYHFRSVILFFKLQQEKGKHVRP